VFVSLPQASFVLLSKSQKLPRVDEQRLIREAQEKKDAEAKANIKSIVHAGACD